jgi:hypothetical protein
MPAISGVPAQRPTFDLKSAEGRKIADLFIGLKRGEHRDGTWEGADVTKALTTWFESMGIDSDGLGILPTTWFDAQMTCAAEVLGEEWKAVGDVTDGYVFSHDSGATVDVKVLGDKPLSYTLDTALYGNYSVEGPQTFTVSHHLIARDAGAALAEKLLTCLALAEEWARVTAYGR